jgi:regulator of sigma E protease
MLLTIIVFIVILGLLIFVHEAGHFIAAKIAKVKVDEFAFGFPPRIVSIKRGETRYSINAIPLGGYVRLYGEEEEIKKPHSFFGRPVGYRIFIVTAGVLMNFILAIILMTIGFTVGMTPLVSDPATLSGTKKSQVMIVYVEPSSAAAKLGLAQGDILNGFSSPTDLQQFTQSHLGETVNLSITQGGKTENLTTQLSSDKNAPLGVGIVSITTVKQNVLTAFWTSIKETGKVIATLFVFLWTIIKSVFTTGHAGQAAEGVVGPVGLFNFTSQALKIGWIYVLQLVALLSINLGIINILPFPALDGGKVLFLALEGIFRKKVIRQEVENIIHLVGFALLIILILAITYRDIIHLR